MIYPTMSSPHRGKEIETKTTRAQLQNMTLSSPVHVGMRIKATVEDIVKADDKGKSGSS